MPVVREAPGNMKIAALLNLVQDRIARLQSDPVLRCQVRDAFGLIEFSVDQVVRRLEFHQHQGSPFRRRDRVATT